MSRTPEGPGINVIALDRYGDRYVFLYDDDARSKAATLQTFGRYAADKELSFSWYDASVLSQKMRALLNDPERDVPEES